MPSHQFPRISVVIPCYNAERYIAAAIESVLAQEWPDLQIVVVDDGSKDASAQIIQQRFPQVLLVQQPNQGVAAARNTGIAASNGEWIAFLDADDLWLPGKLHRQWQSLESNAEAQMAYTAWQTWESSDATPTPAFLSQLENDAHDAAKWQGASGWIYPQLLLDCVVWTSTVLMQRTLLREIGGFNTTLRIGEDYDLWLRASRRTPIARVNAPTALYRQHPESITKSAPQKNYQGEVVQHALVQWGYQSPDGRYADKVEVSRKLARIWSDFGAAHLTSRNFSLAKHGGLMAIRTDWRDARGWKVLAKSILRCR
ncbi:glycosyltransferase family 2 protein [Variovorax sp. HJSM1_2]|uniref:glycosyltransferase family 2 protein n=1 Tax=Variovorax sp. HJSM1_2 TaxID=3366263 RepID=UPI003BDC688C